MDGHLTSEDFRIILTGEGENKAHWLFLRHLAVCRICYAVVAFLSGSEIKRTEAKSEK